MTCFCLEYTIIFRQKIIQPRLNCEANTDSIQVTDTLIFTDVHL